MPTNNPNFGTGYVDWSSYVNANQPGIQADRSKVADYMTGLENQANSQLGASPDMTTPGQQPAQRAGDTRKYAATGTDPFSQAQENVATNQQALQTPGGFENVLAQANAAYDPIKGAAAGKGPPKAEYDPFSAALEGQNAGGLGGTPASQLAPTQPGVNNGVPVGSPGMAGNQNPTGRPEGPSGSKPKRGPNLNDPNSQWSQYLGRQ